MLDKFKNVNWILIVLILLGIRAIVDSNLSLALVVACFSGLYGFQSYLKTKEVKPLEEEVAKRLDEMQSTVAGLAMKNAAKPQQMAQEIRRFF